MNTQPIFDINIYNKYLYYSGGHHLDYNQYQQFVAHLNYQYYLQQNYQAQNYQAQNYPAQNYPVQNPQVSNNLVLESNENKKKYCINGMNCKNINCIEFHHPSKDLDILNQSKNK